MLGGIYGDLAASTYLRDPKIFYEKLFDDKATLSEYGLSVIATIAFVKGGIPKLNPEDRCREIIKSLFEKPDYSIVKYNDYITSWLYDFGFRYFACSGMLLNRLATYAYFSDKPEETAFCVMADRSWDKEEGYARIFVTRMIYYLRHGYTKDETYEMLGDVFKNIRKKWDWKEQNTTLSLLMRAWDCFYNSFDFGSAIHNAVRYPNSNTRQLASLTGLIADAMYGHLYYFKKKQFCSNNEQYIELSLPKRIYDAYEKLISKVSLSTLWDNRVFFPKNVALTNVDRHHFTSYPSKLNNLLIFPDSREKILRAFPTGWEDRFGFYLDNGWIYCYRSFYLLGRFKLVGKGGRYFIDFVQQTEEMPNGMNIDQCITCALHSARVSEAPSLDEVNNYSNV